MSEETKNVDSEAPKAETAEVRKDELDEITGGSIFPGLTPTKINVSANVIGGNKLGGTTPQYPG